MKVISEGLTFTIHRDDIKTYDALPPDFYEVRFGPMTGYSLLKIPPMTITEKVYGSHNQKIRKSLDLRWRKPLDKENYSGDFADKVNAEIDIYKGRTPAYLQMILSKKSSMHYVL